MKSRILNQDLNRNHETNHRNITTNLPKIDHCHFQTLSESDQAFLLCSQNILHPFH